jgi:ribosomal protein S18 acetylase RimI-like enzyme
VGEQRLAGVAFRFFALAEIVVGRLHDRRRHGFGAALVSSVIEHARGRVDQLHAAVVITAEPARALYRKLGFEPYGLEPHALKVGEEYFDQELLVLRLDNRAVAA